VGAAVVEMIPFAFGKMIAVNPTIAVILLLVSAHGSGKALAYVVGALLGPLIAGTLLLPLVGTVAPPQSGGGTTVFGSTLELVIGLASLILVFRGWFKRADRPSEASSLPGWMRTLDHISVIGALALGAVMTVMGVKNLLMLTGVVVAIGEADIDPGQREIVLSGFVLISTIPIAAPLVAVRLLGAHAEETLGAWKAWLVRNSVLVTLGIFLFLGMYFTIRGLVGLVDAST
jgi:hypothetical protein